MKFLKYEGITNMYKKVFTLLAALVLILILAGDIQLLKAQQWIGIRIDGELRNYEIGAVIKDSRTMIPIRFIAEDPALQGQVNWNQVKREARVKIKDREFVFVAGSRYVYIDGKQQLSDVAPYIYNDRLFIPLRFLAENLGAKVGWNASAQEVLINFHSSVKQQVWAYYYYPAKQELQEYGGLFTDLVLRWFQTNGQGDLSYEYRDDYSGVLALAKQKGLKTHASVVLMGKEELHQLLSSEKNRSKLIASLKQQVKENGYDGVNIDFELMYPSDASLYTQFLKELKTALGDQTIVSAAVFARTANDKWATPYDYPQIGKIVDYLVVMSYDYSYPGSAPGPIAPLWWVENVAQYLKTIIPADKILLGMATYGYDWADGLKTKAVTQKTMQDIQSRYKLTQGFDYSSMSPYYTYYDSQGKRHQIWLENQTSLEQKYNVVVNNELAGMSFWRIGTGFYDLYKVLEKMN